MIPHYHYFPSENQVKLSIYADCRPAKQRIEHKTQNIIGEDTKYKAMFT